MKSKIISIFLSCFIFLSSSVTCFASPLVAIPISYELLMGLIAIGGAFGISTQLDDDMYWDYTRSLKKHLQVVDDEYLKLLEESSKDYYKNNNNKPEGERPPFKIPYVPGMLQQLKELFTSVGTDVNFSYKYYNDILNPFPITSSGSYHNHLDSTFTTTLSEPGDSVGFHYYNHYDLPVDVTYSMKSDRRIYINYQVGSYAPVEKSYGIKEYKSYSVGIGFTTDNNICGSPDNRGKMPLVCYEGVTSSDSVVTCRGTTYIDDTYISSSGGNCLHYSKDLKVNTKPSVPYVPSEPGIDKDEVIIPGGLPNIDIPGVETVPGVRPGDDVVPPFEVKPPVIEPGPDPNPNPNPNPGDVVNPGGDTIWDTIANFVKSLLVPSNDFWTNTFKEFSDNFGNAFPMLDMGKFNDLIVEGKPFPNIDIKIMGVEGRVVNGDTINSIVDWMRPIVAGFMMLCLMFFNYRKIYKLIRNSEPFGGIAPGTSDFRTGISENNSYQDNYEIAQSKIRDTMFDIRNEFLGRKNGDK